MPDRHIGSGLQSFQENGKLGYKNKTGKIVIEPEYDTVIMPFNDIFGESSANVIVFENPEEGIKGANYRIDKTGKILTK